MAEKDKKKEGGVRRALRRYSTFGGVYKAHPEIRQLAAKEVLGGLGVAGAMYAGGALGFLGGGLARMKYFPNRVLRVPHPRQAGELIGRIGARMRAAFKPTSKSTAVAVRNVRPSKITQAGHVVYSREPYEFNVPRGYAEMYGGLAGAVGGTTAGAVVASRRQARRAEKVRARLGLPGPAIRARSALWVAPSSRLAWREHVKKVG